MVLSYRDERLRRGVADRMPSRGGAQSTSAPARHTATAVNMGSGPSAAGHVFVNVDRWSSAREREKLVTAFRSKGQAQLLHALENSPKVGFIRLPNTPEQDLRYAFASSLPGGGRRVLLATDRPIGFEEEASASRRLDTRSR